LAYRLDNVESGARVLYGNAPLAIGFVLGEILVRKTFAMDIES